MPLLLPLALHLALGTLGGALALAIGLPMPFLLGSLTAVAPLVIWQSNTGRQPLRFPPALRMGFIAIIGALIGSRFSPDLVAKVPTIWISLLAVTVFVIVAHTIGYAVYRHLGGYDRITALYGSMPGGLIEGVSLGEKAGGDLMLLTVHHFARIVLVVFAVPLFFLFLSGEVVGSAAGETLSRGDSALTDILGIVALAAVGYVFGKKAKIPAGHLMGPLLVVGLLHGAGLADFGAPPWLVSLAQLVVGTALATQFSGATIRTLLHAFSLTAIAVLAMFAVAGAMATFVSHVTIMDFEDAFISFAPGGVAEMGLIALSLDASPVLVAVHHLVRIVLTVILVRLAHQRLFREGSV